MNKIKNIVVTSVIALAAVVSPMILASSPVQAASCKDKTPAECIKSGGDQTVNQSKKGDGFEASLKSIVNLVLYILGAIAVIVIIIGGVRYTVSGGDSSAIKGAKDTILYAVVGLIVAILAYAIVNFVLGAFTP